MTLFPPMTDERSEGLRHQENRRRDLADRIRHQVCKVCEGLLGMRRWWDGEWCITCMGNWEHQGIERERPMPQKPYGIGNMKGDGR